MKIKRDELVAGGVALAAFLSSAQHIYAVCALAGNPGLVAAIHPLGIDGLVYIGIRAMQRGNKGAGASAIAYGALYSLAFNAASYGAFPMPTWALAACMPLAMVFAFLIVHGGHGKIVEPIEEEARVVEVIRTVERIVEVDVEVPVEVIRTVEKIVEVDVPTYVPVPSRTRPAPASPSNPGQSVPSLDVDVKPRTRPRDVDVDATRAGRTAAWDVEKAVALLDEGRTHQEIGDAVGISFKPIQRTARALRLIRTNPDWTDGQVGDASGVSASHVARIRAAVTK